MKRHSTNHRSTTPDHASRFPFDRLRLPMLVIVAGGLLGTTMGGCVSQKRYDELDQTNRALQEQNARLLGSAQQTAQSIEMESSSNEDLRSAVSARDALIARLEGDLAAERQARQGDLAEFEAIINELDVTVIDPATDRALAQLARENSDLVSYDPERGMLRFNSDLTFDSGSDVVKDGAMASLRRLAGVLRGVGATYDLDIVGHTDSQRPSANTQRRHPTNVHLSAHRAISVRRALTEMGVPATKMRVAGWGEHRPAVANNPSGGTAANRRVEIFLSKSTATGGALASPQRTPTTASPTNVPIDRERSTRPRVDTVK